MSRVCVLNASSEVAVACSQAAANPGCTFYSVKRLIGRDCSAVQDDARQAPALSHSKRRCAALFVLGMCVSKG